MKIVDTNSGPPGAPFRVRVNRSGRRTYSREYKLEIVDECSAPGASVAAIALSHRINANLVRRWIVQQRAGGLNGASSMVPVIVASSGRLAPTATPGAWSRRPSDQATGVIEIELEGVRVRVRGVVDEAGLRTVLDALAKR